MRKDYKQNCMMSAENQDKIRKTAQEITLSNSSLQITFSSFGAAIRKIKYKKENAEFKNIAFTLKPEEACSKNASYAGATLAPAAGRIEKGLLYIDGNTYQLTKNEQDKHHLHGGHENLSFAFWEITKQTKDTLIFSASLKDGTDGYPGNRKFLVEYTLQGNCLDVRQYAESDKKTYFNLSNHAYFNLNAFSASGLNQHLMIAADQVVLNNEEHIPQNAISMKGTPFDFLSYANIGERFCAYPENTQFQMAQGLNHYFLLSEKDASAPTCSLLSANKELMLRLYTDAPALVVYSGGFIDNSSYYEGTDGNFHPTYPGCAVAIEPSELPFFQKQLFGTMKFSRLIRWEFS